MAVPARREYLHGIAPHARVPRAACLAALAVAGCAPPGEPPDVLLVTVDTLRADHTSLHGYERPTTPCLERWFAEARVFARAYAPEANTSPSVVSILTGLLPQNHGVRLLYQKVGDEVTTLADRFRAEGYRTGAVVSNIVLTDEAIGLAARFDHYDDFVDEERDGFGVYERNAARTTDAALAWLLDAEAAAPHFLWVHYIDPHGPYDPPDDAPADWQSEGFVAADPERIPDYQRVGEAPENAFEWIDRYDEEIAYVDREIGRLLDGYRELGHAEDAVIALTADHGETMIGYERWFTHGFHVYEPILHVPFAVRAPGLEPARVEEPVSIVAVAPTLLELAGLPVPEDLDAASVARAAPGGPVFGEATGRDGTQWRTAVHCDRKWITMRTREADSPEIRSYPTDRERELFPGEPTPAGDPTAAALRALVASDPDPGGIPREFVGGTRLDAPKVAPGVAEETLAKLRKLGYAD